MAIPDLAFGPGEFAAQRVEVEGVADWYTDLEGSADCVCAGGICACIKPLAMRATHCGDQIRLAGQYRGRPVECSDAGCWPLQPLSQYAICGLFSWDVGAPRPGGEGKIELEAVCER